MSFVITVGRLVSTTDIKLARKLQQVVKLDDITKGTTPEALRQSKNRLSFMLAGEYYELERVS
jgi:hypothetical protein